MISGIKINEKRKEEYIRKGFWEEKTLLDYWNETVKKYPRKLYVVDDRGHRYTYKQVDILASKLASYLYEIGIREHDIVSFQIPVWSEFAIIAMAILKLGAVMHPLAMFYEMPDLIRAFQITGAKVYIGVSTFNRKDYEGQISAVKEQAESLQHIILLGGDGEYTGKYTSFESILREYKAFTQKPSVTGFDIALILSTSGTTGGSKGVLFTHNNILFSEKGFIRELHLDFRDIMFMASPLNHATGFHHGIIANMLMGARLVLQQRFEAKKAIAMMRKEKCTYSMGATPFIYDLVKVLKGEEGLRIPSLKLYLCGGAPVPEYIVKDAYTYGIEVCEVYGSTESVPHVYVRREEVLSIMGKNAGKPMEGIEVRVISENGEMLPPGAVGEEVSRGPNVFVGYLNNMDATNRYLDDEGWFHSGDLCMMDEEGNIKIIGRKKDMIVRGGENLDSNEINDYLEGFAPIVDHTVVGMPDERLGERICAYVVAKQSFELEELKAYLQGKSVPKRFWPERVEFVEEIPRTHSGKVKKFLLQEDIRRKLGKMRD